MPTRATPFVSALTAAAFVLSLAPAVHAQEASGAPSPVPYNQAQPVQYPTQPQPAQPQPQYTAPIYQQTQPSYVPQSVALSGPRELKDWQDGDPIPPGYHRVERTRTGLLVGGAVTFGVLYLLSVLVAAANADANMGSSNPAAALYIPVAGPFVQMPQSDSSSLKVMLAIDGIAQAAGATMFIVGLTSPKTVLLRNDLGQNKPKLTVAPIVSKTTSGLGLVGTF